MNGKVIRLSGVIVLALCLMVVAGCGQTSSNKDGIQVMFDGNPHIFKQDVYYLGKTIGKVLEHSPGNGSAYRVIVQLSPEFGKIIGKHWAFYVDNGGLQVTRIYGSGEPLAAGDKLCGFGSQAALNWFKLKTLLNDRVYKANQKAESLARRFGP